MLGGDIAGEKNRHKNWQRVLRELEENWNDLGLDFEVRLKMNLENDGVSILYPCVIKKIAYFYIDLPWLVS